MPKSNLVHLSFPTFDFSKFLMRVVVAMSQTNLSYCDLAHRTNLSEGTICRIMSRRSKNMYVTTVAKIAEALKISADYLLDLRRARTLREKEVEQEAQYNLRVEKRKRHRKGA
jgi:transcriptional regulator with XRE-family HTH domain